MGGIAPSRNTVFRWWLQFHQRSVNFEDELRTGRPKTVGSQENVNAVQKLLIDDRRIAYKKIEHTLGINAPQLHEILHDHLKLKKSCTLWIRHQSEIRSEISKR